MNRLLTTLLFVLVFSIHSLHAQCLVHPTSDTLCENSTSLLPVQLLGPTFATADSFLYELNGQGIDGSLSITWLDTGDYQLIVSGLNPAGQVTCIDTGNFYVAPLPQLSYVMTTSDSQCFEGNKLCFRNESTIWREDSGSATYKILWGDGSAQVSEKLNVLESVCYSYNSLQSRQYTVSVELIDQRGCLSTQQYSSNYLKGISPALFHIDSIWCGPVSYGGSTFSINFDSSQIDSFVWMVDSIPFESTHLAFAYPLDISGVHTFSLTIWSKDGCSTSYSQLSSIFNPKIFKDKGDTLFVKDGTISFHTPPIKNALYLWDFGDPSSGPNNFLQKNTGTHVYRNPGKSTVVLLERLTGCPDMTDTLTLFITGPLALITPPAYTVRASCSSADTVSLSQSNLYYFNDANPSDEDLVGGKRSDHVKGIWDFGDLTAPACTTDTRNGLNVNSNCRYSLDSAAKHLFGSQETYTVHYTATDTVSMESTFDSLTLQFGTPKLDDFEFELICSPYKNDFYLHWNTNSRRPQTTFRILIDSAADRNDNTPNVLDAWINEGQTLYNPSTPNPFVKFFGTAIHQVYIDPGLRQAFHEDGYITVGLQLINGDSNSAPGYCDTIIWFHKAVFLPRQSLGFSSTLTEYPASDSLSFNLADRRLKDISQLDFGFSVDFTLDDNFSFGYGRRDDIIRDHQVGANTYDYILRSESSSNGPEMKDSILIRHSNGGTLLFQDWRDTLIELPPTQFLRRSGRFTNWFHFIEGCDGSQLHYVVNGHGSTFEAQYPYPDTFLFVGDTLQLNGLMLYTLLEPDPITGQTYDPYEYWLDPTHYASGNFRPAPQGGYETVEWKANGVTFADSVDALFIPADTGWYTIEMISTDSTGKSQKRSIELPVFGINPILGLLPDTSSLGPKMENGDPQTAFNSDLNGLLINRDCEYYIQFEQQSVVLDPCIGRYGVPCLPEIKTGVKQGNTGPVSLFTNGEPVILPFDLLQENQYALVYEVSQYRTIQYDTLIDLEIDLGYLVIDSILCNDEALMVNNLSNGLGQDVQYLLYAGDEMKLFGDTSIFVMNSLPRGSLPVFVDAYPGEFVPGGIYCPVRTQLSTIQVNGANQIEISGNVSGSAGQINLYMADIGHSGSGTYQWTIDNGSLLSASNKDTISAIFNQGSGKLMVFYTESLCPAVSDTLYFLSTGFSQIAAGHVSLYPNPTKGRLHIDGLEGKAVIHVYSSEGAEVFSREVTLNNFEINGLKPGLYLLKVDGLEGSHFRFILEE